MNNLNIPDNAVDQLPRFTENDRFCFACHPQISCFNRCCSDVNIFLTPYDVLRLKTRLQIRSGDFLDRYTLLPFHKEQRLPVVQFQMHDDETKRCFFVTEAGCSLYEDRPWACRMYPIGLASRGTGTSAEHFYFLLEEDHCQGHKETKEWTIKEWLHDQGVSRYEEMNRAFQEITLLAYQHPQDFEPRQMDMFFMASYDLDRFRDFLFGSSFFQRFEVPEPQRETLRHDDEALLLFAMEWLKFSLFHQPTMTLRP